MAIHYWNRTARLSNQDKWAQGKLDQRFSKTISPYRAIRLKNAFNKHSLGCGKCVLDIRQRILKPRKGLCTYGRRLLIASLKATRLHWKFHPFIRQDYRPASWENLKYLAHSRAEAFRKWRRTDLTPTTNEK